jgi:hypothetical protein
MFASTTARHSIAQFSATFQTRPDHGLTVSQVETNLRTIPEVVCCSYIDRRPNMQLMYSSRAMKDLFVMVTTRDP